MRIPTSAPLLLAALRRHSPRCRRGHHGPGHQTAELRALHRQGRGRARCRDGSVRVPAHWLPRACRQEALAGALPRRLNGQSALHRVDAVKLHPAAQRVGCHLARAARHGIALRHCGFLAAQAEGRCDRNWRVRDCGGRVVRCRRSEEHRGRQERPLKRGQTVGHVSAER